MYIWEKKVLFLYHAYMLFTIYGMFDALPSHKMRSNDECKFLFTSRHTHTHTAKFKNTTGYTFAEESAIARSCCEIFVVCVCKRRARGTRRQRMSDGLKCAAATASAHHYCINDFKMWVIATFRSIAAISCIANCFVFLYTICAAE